MYGLLRHAVIFDIILLKLSFAFDVMISKDNNCFACLKNQGYHNLMQNDTGFG